MGETISKSLRDRLANEARHRCGYCLTDQRVNGAQMHIEHIIPRARGGQSTESNLWLLSASSAWVAGSERAFFTLQLALIIAAGGTTYAVTLLLAGIRPRHLMAAG